MTSFDLRALSFSVARRIAGKALLTLMFAFGLGFWVAVTASGCRSEPDEPLPEVELSGGELPEENGTVAHREAELEEDEPRSAEVCAIPEAQPSEPDCA